MGGKALLPCLQTTGGLEQTLGRKTDQQLGGKERGRESKGGSRRERGSERAKGEAGGKEK